MSDPQRTHPATPKRIREFRKRGEIALSRDLVTAAAFAAGAIALLATAGGSLEAMRSLAHDGALGADGRDVSDLSGTAVHTFVVAVGPVVGAAALAAIVAIGVQLGWPPALKGFGFDLGRMSPLSNLGNAFGLGGMAKRSGLAFVKLGVVGAIVFAIVRHAIGTHAMDAGSLAAAAGSTMGHALLAVAGTLGALAAFDYVMARRRIGAKMKMTPDEAKREMREQDGDPMLKGRRKARMKELAKRRVAQAVAKADVIVVNPTHYAVALRYDDATDRAPIVVAKGTDEAAEKIREIARQHGVPILSRPPLARALHKHVKEGRPIPANLFKAVAEVLAYVYRLRRRAQ